MIKNIIFFANDFGLGPTSRAHTISSKLKSKHEDKSIKMITSGRSDHALNYSDIPIEQISSLRDEQVIAKYLSQYESAETLVICSFNRFALSSAKSFSIKTVILDGLFWFWKNRPSEYDLADYEFRFVLPWQLNKYKSSGNVHYFAGPVEVNKIDTKTKERSEKDNMRDLLFTLNGFYTPFYEPANDIYLRFIEPLIEKAALGGNRVTVAGSQFAIDRLNPLSDNINVSALSKKDYLRKLSSSDLVLLNGGSNSFLEAAVMQRPMIFSLPSNQSQYELIKEVSTLTESKLESWCPALGLVNDHHKISEFEDERSAIKYMTKLYSDTHNNEDFEREISECYQKVISSVEFFNRNDDFKKIFKEAEPSLDSTSQVVDALNNIINSS